MYTKIMQNENENKTNSKDRFQLLALDRVTCIPHWPLWEHLLEAVRTRILQRSSQENKSLVSFGHFSKTWYDMSCDVTYCV